VSQPIEVPWDQLQTDTLQALVEEFVTREGTDYGAEEVALTDKVQQVIRGIQQGLYVILYDPDLDSVHIITARDWQGSGF